MSEADEIINYEFEDEPRCPHCGHPHDDLFDIEGIYDEDGTDIDCESCGKTFTSYCHPSYSFSTCIRDYAAEEARRQEDRKKILAKLDKLKESAGRFTPGMTVRVVSEHHRFRGRTGVVANEERDGGVVKVNFEECMTTLWPDALEEVTT